MSVLWLIRHGQAGTRENYDALSDLGRTQAGMLAEYFSKLGVRFDQVISGAMTRQVETARLALAGAEIAIDPGWNEFDLAAVYERLAPRLRADDAEFALQYERMQSEITAARENPAAPVHRRWNDCDRRIVRAWVEARYENKGESWAEFRERIVAALRRIRATEGSNKIVFTSATPIGICAAETFLLGGAQVFQFAGVLFNASVTTLRDRSDELRLFTFNGTPHLTNPGMQTFR